MIVYRLAIDMYKEDLSGTGAKLVGGRWNNTGHAVLYTTENISLAVLEILVRADAENIPLNYHLLKITIPDDHKAITITKSKLKAGWKDDLGLTQWLGTEFIKAGESLLLKVPSAIVDEEHNFILNPKHPQFKTVKITSTKKFHFDKRLFLKDE
jgi:RES domain-containing protein